MMASFGTALKAGLTFVFCITLVYVLWNIVPAFIALFNDATLQFFAWFMVIIISLLMVVYLPIRILLEE